MPSDVRAFHNWMREAFAATLQERTAEGRTQGEEIIRTLVRKAINGDQRALEYVLDRMGGKPQQSLELSANVTTYALTDADKEAARAIVMRLREVGSNQPSSSGTAGTELSVRTSDSISGPLAHPQVD